MLHEKSSREKLKLALSLIYSFMAFRFKQNSANIVVWKIFEE